MFRGSLGVPAEVGGWCARLMPVSSRVSCRRNGDHLLMLYAALKAWSAQRFCCAIGDEVVVFFCLIGHAMAGKPSTDPSCTTQSVCGRIPPKFEWDKTSELNTRVCHRGQLLATTCSRRRSGQRLENVQIAGHLSDNQQVRLKQSTSAISAALIELLRLPSRQSDK